MEREKQNVMKHCNQLSHEFFVNGVSGESIVNLLLIGLQEVTADSREHDEIFDNKMLVPIRF